MWNELDVVRAVSNRLDMAGLEFMLTGSMAMNYYAQPRMTRNIDLVIALTASDASKIAPIFTPDYYVSPEAVRDAIAHESMFNLIHEDSITKVDFIVRSATAIMSKTAMLSLTTNPWIPCSNKRLPYNRSELVWLRSRLTDLAIGQTTSELQPKPKPEKLRKADD